MARQCAPYLRSPGSPYSMIVRPNADETDSHVEAGTINLVVPPAPTEPIDY